MSPSPATPLARYRSLREDLATTLAAGGAGQLRQALTAGPVLVPVQAPTDTPEPDTPDSTGLPI